MDMKEKLAVLKLAGYEVRQVTIMGNTKRWDWNLFVNGEHTDSSDTYHRTKSEAVNDAFEWMVLYTPKETIA